MENEIAQLKKENLDLRNQIEFLKLKRGENQKKGMIKKAEAGKIMSRPAFGYKLSSNVLIIDSENSKTVEDIFLEFYNSTTSLNRMAKKYGFSINGLKKILTNFTYLGKVKFNGEIHSAEHPAILSSTLFNQVQDKLERLNIKK